MSLRFSALALLLLATIACFCTFGSTEFVDFKACPDVEDNCLIEQVNVSPCPDAAEHLPCKIKRRGATKMTFDFTPKFAATGLEAQLYWVKSASEQLPLASMDHEACKYTTCPVAANQKYTYSMDVPIDKKFPTGAYTIKWLLKETGEGSKQCCFTIDIKVVRR